MNSINILLMPITILLLVSVVPSTADILLPAPLSAQACEGNTLSIKCDNGRINVISANYGRLSKTECNSDGRSPILSTNCISTNSVDVVTAKCNNEQQCTVPATNQVFLDPCYGTYKYLDVNYSCIQNTPPPKIIKKIACEGKQLEIECEQGEEINVLSANYGRSSTSVCSSDTCDKTINCESRAKSKLIVSSKCSNKRQCTVWATNDVFGDPCVNTYKYLEVEYTCETEKCL